MESLSVVILAAGMGKRMRSQLPKVLHSVCGWSLLERALRAAVELSPQDIVVVVGHGKEEVEAEIARVRAKGALGGIEIKTAHQTEQRGTGDAANVALPSASGENVLILPGDIPLITAEPLRELVFQSQQTDLGLLSVMLNDPHGYGRIIRSVEGEIEKIVEEADCSPDERMVTEVNVSIYVGRKAFFESALSSLSSDNAQGELYLTDVVGVAVSQEKRVVAVQTYFPASVAGANTRLELGLLERTRRQEINAELMESGVTIEDIDTVFIDEDVRIGVDSFLGTGTRLKGNTIIGEHVVCQGDTIIKDAHIAHNCEIRLGCLIDSAEVGENSIVGPFAHLRPGTKLHSDVKIGNFVETKKAELKSGTKVNHLSYVGDAEVGSNVNIGAGTITCNYDGISKKSKTRIEDDVAIGSNTALVAPITIGARAIIGAGSTITKNVPADALGIERAHQREIPSWAKKKREQAKKDNKE